jgi:LCP family protein required for cell wall assembly
LHGQFDYALGSKSVILRRSLRTKKMENKRQTPVGSSRASIDGFAELPVFAKPERPRLRLDTAEGLHLVVHHNDEESVRPAPGPQPLVQRSVRPSPARPQHQPAAPIAIEPPLKKKEPVRMSLLDMSLPGEASHSVRHPEIRRRISILRHWVFKTVVVALILLVGAGALLFTEGFFTTQKVFKGGATAAALQKNVDPTLLKGEGDGRINILLMGIGGPGHDGSDRTDTMVVASIDPVNNKAVLLSVPRDLWVQVPKHGSMKINAAYAMGKYDVLHKASSSNDNTDAVKNGFAVANQTVESVLGIDIHYNALINFQAFKQAVDAVGGVTVNVPTDLVDPTMAWENNWNPVLAKAGNDQFDGKQALLYVRSRHTSSDFARSERQRALILALKQKAVTLGTISNPIKLSKLMSSLGNNAVTDMSVSDAMRLYSIGKKISEPQVKSLDFVTAPNTYVKTGRVGNQSVDLPVAGMYDYGAIQTFVRSALPDGYLAKEHAKVDVLNGTAIEGLAEDTATNLEGYGYTVGTVTNAPTKDYGKSVLIDLSHGKNPYTKNYLERHFNLKATTRLPANSSIQKGTADFILIVGNDEAISR